MHASATFRPDIKNHPLSLGRIRDT
jgi:hypothetical protein